MRGSFGTLRDLTRRRLPALTVAALSLLAGRSFGFVYITSEHARWPGPAIPVVVQLGNSSRVLQDGSLSFNQSIENAMALWNQQIANAQFTWREEPRTRAASPNGTTTISFEANVYGDAFGRDTLAVTIVTNSGTRLIETDVMFNVKRWVFDSYFGPLENQSAEDLHRIGLHELGHSLGLDHPNEKNQAVLAIMNANVSNLDHLQADDVAGAQSLYGVRADAPPVTKRGRLANISTRVRVGAGDDVLIGGFITRDGTKQVLIRALGPSLPLAGRLADPTLELHDANGAVIAANDNWKETQRQAIEATTIPPSSDFEAAILATLPPGTFTAVVSGKGGMSGTALVEVYDLSPGTGRIANISTRGRVSTGNDVMIGGFIVAGPESQRCIIRGMGPSLRPAVPTALFDTSLELRNGNGVLMASNTGWRNAPNLNLGAYGLSAMTDAESAIGCRVVPGNYTVILKSPTNGSGIGLVEVYDVNP